MVGCVQRSNVSMTPGHLKAENPNCCPSLERKAGTDFPDKHPGQADSASLGNVLEVACFIYCTQTIIQLPKKQIEAQVHYTEFIAPLLFNPH